MPERKTHVINSEVPILETFQDVVQNTIEAYIKNSLYLDQEVAVLFQQIQSRLLRKVKPYVGKGPEQLRVIIIDLVRQLCNDEEDLGLWRQDSPNLVKKYAYQTLAIINKYVREGRIQEDQRDFFFEVLL